MSRHHEYWGYPTCHHWLYHRLSTHRIDMTDKVITVSIVSRLDQQHMPVIKGFPYILTHTEVRQRRGSSRSQPSWLAMSLLPAWQAAWSPSSISSSKETTSPATNTLSLHSRASFHAPFCLRHCALFNPYPLDAAQALMRRAVCPPA